MTFYKHIFTFCPIKKEKREFLSFFPLTFSSTKQLQDHPIFFYSFSLLSHSFLLLSLHNQIKPKRRFSVHVVDVVGVRLGERKRREGKT